MTDILASSITEALDSMKKSANGMPNVLLRDIQSIHVNSTLDELPDSAKGAILNCVSSALSRLQAEGFVITKKEFVTPVKATAAAHRKRNPNQSPNRR